MKNSTNKKCDIGSNLSEAGKVGIKNRLKIFATSALLLAAKSALQGSFTYPLVVIIQTRNLHRLACSTSTRV